MLSRRSVLLPITLALAITPVAATAGSTPPRPKAGNWKVVALFNLTKSGRFKVTKDRSAVIALRVVPGSGANASCGTTEMRVLGTLKLSKASRGGTTIWIVGKNRPQTSDGVEPVKVTVKQGTKTFKGTLKMTFQENARAGDGQLELPGCDLLAFGTKKVK